ncbi:MAG: stage 0 sporulation family protein [Anaerolineae bacterium]|nr:stage 0 sporulation family protein [Anaerolineae bacterium]
MSIDDVAISHPTETKQRKVAGVRFIKIGKLYHFDTSAYSELGAGDYVIVETARGRNMGQIIGFMEVDDSVDVRPILRPATARDLVLKQQWEAQQDEALQIFVEKASKLGAYHDVKFIAAQYNYDGSLLTILVTAEDRVNVNPLINETKRLFNAQIDIRQIGPRDVAKILGGYGACGELRCCSTFLTDFSPVSIKMAKAQGISLNPTEITGMCGRLRCCLVYEYEQYVAARKTLPKRNKRVGTPAGIGRVVEVYPLTDSVLVHLEEDGRQMFKREDIIPIEELEALQRKAKEPCSKHGDEPCDCGKPVGERNQDKVKPSAQVTASAPEASMPATDESPAPKNSNNKRKQNRFKRGKSSKKGKSDKNQPPTAS